MCRRFRTDSLASPKAIYAKRLGRSSSNRSGCNGMLLKAQQCERERLKKAGHIVPWVFFRIVAEGRRGPKKPRQILTLTKAWRAACAAAGHPGIILHDLRRSAVRNMCAEESRKVRRCSCRAVQRQPRDLDEDVPSRSSRP
jgi:integrase